MKRLLLATNNSGKVRELRRLLTGCGFEVVTPAEVGINLDVDETGATYGENATIKARAFAAAGHCLALADDSGIEVDALGGKPGVHSARYGQPGLDDTGRVQYLLHELQGVAPSARTARYRALVAIAGPNGSVTLFEGVQEGHIATEPAGENGFGYDPVFLVDDARTQAQISDEEKDKCSHRAKAVRAALGYLRSVVA